MPAAQPLVQLSCGLAALGLLGIGIASDAAGQPAPSFLATCAELRAKTETLDLTGDPLITIQVEGEILELDATSALVYVTLCDPPAPKVVCVTYSREGRKIGDTVVVSGSYYRRNSILIILDPCLHHTH